MFEQVDDPKLSLSGPKTLRGWLLEKAISVAIMIGVVIYVLMAVE